MGLHPVSPFSNTYSLLWAWRSSTGILYCAPSSDTHLRIPQQIQIGLVPQSPGISCNGCYQYRIDTPCLILFDIAMQIRCIAVLCLRREASIIMPELEKYIIAGLAVLRRSPHNALPCGTYLWSVPSGNDSTLPHWHPNMPEASVPSHSNRYRDNRDNLRADPSLWNLPPDKPWDNSSSTVRALILGLSASTAISTVLSAKIGNNPQVQYRRHL